MKKIISIFLSVALIISVMILFSCSKKSDLNVDEPYTVKDEKTESQLEVQSSLVDNVSSDKIDSAKAELPFSERIIQYYKAKNSEALKELILPLKKNKPIYDGTGSDEDKAYFELGKILQNFYDDNDTGALIYFLENGASPFIETGFAPIVYSYLFSSIKDNNSNNLQKLLDAGAGTNVYSEFGNVTSDLSYAIECKAYDCMEVLLKLGVNPNLKEKIVFIGEPGSIEKNAVYDARYDKKALELLFNYGAKEGTVYTKKYPEQKDGKHIDVQININVKKVEDDFVFTEERKIKENIPDHNETDGTILSDFTENNLTVDKAVH